MSREFPALPLDALWQARALSWIVVGGEGLAVVLALAPGHTHDPVIYFGLTSLWVQWVSLASLGSLYAGRRWLNRLPAVQVGAIALLLGLLYCWLITWLARWYFGTVGATASMDWRQLALQASGITLTVGALGLAAFDNYRRGRMHAIRAKQAELEALQARIRPHFLFNTLNTGAALVHARPGEAERLLLDLADLFRAALSGPRLIPLADELALARRYLEIEGLRFGERLRVAWDLPDPLPAMDVPALSIQPLVENAIRHGVEPSEGGGTIEVCVRGRGDSILIEVRNGLPPPGAQPTPGHQVGQASVRERISALSQGRGRLETRVEDGRYVATIILPAARQAPTTR